MMTLLSRSNFLKTIALGVTLTLVSVAVKPTPSASVDRRIPLPKVQALPGWAMQSSEAIAPQSSNSRYHRVLSGERYVYRQRDRVLQVAIRDVVETEGDLNVLMANVQEPSVKSPDSWLDRRSSHGFYRLFTQENQAYLQTCLNRNGYATVTPTQFRQNAYAQVLQPQQWFGWLLSQRPLLERRCLWIQISTPVINRNTQQAYTVLEQSWSDLVDRW